MFFHNCPCLNVLSGMNLTSFCSPLELFSVKMLNYHELKSGVRRILKEKQWLKTVVFVQGCDCCAALPQAIDKTSSCFFHVGQISHQHLSHELSNLIIHSLKASQLGDDVIEDVFPDMFPAWTHRVATPNPQYPSKSEQNNPESLKTKTLKRTAACRVGQ